MDKQLTFYSFY